MKFNIPISGEKVIWEDHFSEFLRSVNFLPMLLDVKDGTPYLVVSPMSCESYNKWGRPNPPYVIFKYQTKLWQRISLQELPLELKTPNIIFSAPDIEVRKLGRKLISADVIRQITEGYSQPRQKTILREVKPLPNSCAISTNAKGELFAPALNGEILYFNWWPLATDWLDQHYGR